MSIDINNTIISSTIHSNNFTISNEYRPDFYYTQNNSTGIVTLPYYTTSSNTIPMFNVGLSTSTSPTNSPTNTSNPIPFNYTGGNGYFNSLGCYNTSTYRFTAPLTGLYLFRQNVYVDLNSPSIGGFIQPFFAVNGSTSSRRVRQVLLIRLYGFPGNLFDDTTFSEIIYLINGDFVDVRVTSASGVRYYGAYSSWSGTYLRG